MDISKVTPLLLIILALSLTPVYADIYKCVKNGMISYQDFPCAPASRASRVAVDSSDAGPAWPWTGIKFGASVQDVQRNIPGVQQAMGSHLYDGSKALLKKQGVTIAGIIFEASYFFKDGKFTQVNLVDPDMNDNEVTHNNFERLSSELRSQFGPELKRNVKNERWGTSGEASWPVGNGRVWVSILPVTADTSQLSLGYKPSR